MQTVIRSVDAENLGYESAVVALPNSRTEEFAGKHQQKVFNLNVRFKYADFIAARSFGKILRKFNADICVIGKTELLSIAIAGRNSYSPKTALALYQQMQSGIRKIDWFHNRIYRNLDGAIVLTNLMKRQLTETTIFPESKIAVVPYGLNLEKYRKENYDKAELRRKFDLPSDKFIFGCAARIEPEKGQESAIRAFADAKLENAILVFAGLYDNMEYYRHLLKLSEELGVSDKVKYLGFVNDMPALMNAFDAFLLPSMSETFGIVIVEAQAASLPVAATDGGGVPEIIVNGETGFTFKQKDWQKLSSIMREIYSNPEKLLEMGKKARTSAENKYDYNIQRDKFFDFCNKMYLLRNKNAIKNKNNKT